MHAEDYDARVGALYLRVSTDEQAQHGYSLETQEQLGRDRAARDGLTVERVYEDRGFSGSRSDRPGYQAMFAAAAAGEFDVLFVWKLDRLGRDAEELLRAKRMLKAAGVRIASVTEGESESNLVFGVRALVAQEEREKIAERVRTGKAAAARKGRPNGGRRRFGFRSENGKLLPVSGEVAVAKRILTEFVEGRTQTEIAKRLNRDGYATAEGKAWNQPRISQLIRDPVWVGKIENKEGVFDGEHGAVVPVDLWDQAQRMRRSGSSRGRRAASIFLLGNGMLRCGRCGSSMCVRREKKDYGEYQVYMCYGRTSGQTECDRPVVSRALVDSATLTYFETVGLDVDATIAEAATSRETQLAEIRAARDHAQATARKAQDQIDRVARDYRDGEISAAEWRELIEQPESDRAAANAADACLVEQADAVVAATDLTDATDEVLVALTAIRAAVAGDITSAESVEAARAAIRRIFSHFVLHESLTTPGGWSLAPVPHPDMVVAKNLIAEEELADPEDLADLVRSVQINDASGRVVGRIPTGDKVRRVPLTRGGIKASGR